MTNSNKQYAQALYELTKDKSLVEAKDIVQKFVKDLKRQRLLKESENIIKKFIEIYNAKNHIVNLKILTARELDKDSVDKLKKFVKEKYKADKVETDVQIRRNLKGGVKIIVGEDVLDNTVLGRLRKIKQAIG